MARSPDDYLRFFKILLRGADSAGHLSDEALDSLRVHLSKNPEALRSADDVSGAMDDWITRAKNDPNLDITSDAVDFFKKTLSGTGPLNTAAIRGIMNFGGNLSTNFRSADMINKTHITQWVDDLSKKLNLGDELKKEFAGPLQKECEDMLARRNGQIYELIDDDAIKAGTKNYKELLEKAIEDQNPDVVEAIRKAAQERSDIYKKLDADGAKPFVEASDDVAETTAEQVDNIPPESVPEPDERGWLRKKLSSIFNRSSDGGGPKKYDPDVVTKITAEQPLYQWTIGAWRSHLSNVANLPTIIWNRFVPRRGALNLLPNYRVGVNHIQPRIGDFDKALSGVIETADGVKTSALDEFVDLHSQIRKVTHALKNGGEIGDETITTGNVVRNIQEVMANKLTNEPEYKEALEAFHKKLLTMRESFDDIKPVTDSTKKDSKYSYLNGLDQRHKTQLIEWMDGNIKKVEFALDPKADGDFLKLMQKQVDLIGKKFSSDVMGKTTDSLNAIIDSAIGDRFTNGFYVRNNASILDLDMQTGGFRMAAKGDEPIFGETAVLWRDQHQLQEALANHAYNPTERVKHIDPGDGPNLGSLIGSPMDRYKKMMNPDGTGGNWWEKTGDLREMKAGILNLIDFGPAGENAACEIMIILRQSEGKNVLQTMPATLKDDLLDVAKKAESEGNEYRARAIRNVVDNYEKFKYDSNHVGSPRDNAAKNIELVIHNLINKVDKSVNDITFKDFLNPWNYRPGTGKVYDYVLSFGNQSSPASDTMWGHVTGTLRRGIERTLGSKVTHNLDNKELIQAAKDAGRNYVGHGYSYDRGIIMNPLRAVYRATGLDWLDPRNLGKSIGRWPIEVKRWQLTVPFAGYATADAAKSTYHYIRTDDDDAASPIEFITKTGMKWVHDTATPLIWIGQGARWLGSGVGSGVGSLGYGISSAIAYSVADEGEKDDYEVWKAKTWDKMGDIWGVSWMDKAGAAAGKWVDGKMPEGWVKPVQLAKDFSLKGKEFNQDNRELGKSYNTLKEATIDKAIDKVKGVFFGDGQPKWQNLMINSSAVPQAQVPVAAVTGGGGNWMQLMQTDFGANTANPGKLNNQFTVGSTAVSVPGGDNISRGDALPEGAVKSDSYISFN